jgi:hypothetical protein
MKESERESERRGLPLGTVLQDRSTGTSAAVLVGIGLLVGAIGVLLLVTGSAAVGLLFIAGGAASLFFGGKALRIKSKWLNPELHLPSTSPLRLGDDVIARFRRVARQEATAAGVTMKAWLTCTEAATYTTSSGTGSDRRTRSTTATNVLYRADVAVTPHVAGATVEADLRVVVPVFEAPPSMDLRSNDIIWRLEVHIEAPEGPDDTSSFVIMVAPEISPVLLAPGGRPQ